jgi:hypothetical protein
VERFGLSQCSAVGFGAAAIVAPSKHTHTVMLKNIRAGLTPQNAWKAVVWVATSFVVKWLVDQITGNAITEWITEQLSAWLNVPEAKVTAIIIEIVLYAAIAAALIYAIYEFAKYELTAQSVPTDVKGADDPPSVAKKEIAPYDTEARSALQYAISRSWQRRPRTGPISPEFTAEVARSFDVLNDFYQLASAGSMRVWGRTDQTRPHKLIETTHWQDWQIEHASVFADLTSEPLRTIPRDRLPRDSSPYFDLRLNKAEVESFWPLHDFVPILEAAKTCFEETGLFSDVSMGGELRLYQFIVLLIMEAHDNPDLLEVWGAQVPSEKMSRVPPKTLHPRNLRENGSEIHTLGEFGPLQDWVKISIPQFQLPGFIDRLRRDETAGQQPDVGGPQIKTHSKASPLAPPELKMIAVRFRDQLGAQPPYNEAKEIFLSEEAERIRERVIADQALEPYAKELWDAARALLGCYEALWVKVKVPRNSPGADPGEIKFGHEWRYTNDPVLLKQVIALRARLSESAAAVLNLRNA